MSLNSIAQILDDLFGIPADRVEMSDNLRIDWGLDDVELAKFDQEFWAEFGAIPLDRFETVGEYVEFLTCG